VEMTQARVKAVVNRLRDVGINVIGVAMSAKSHEQYTASAEPPERAPFRVVLTNGKSEVPVERRQIEGRVDDWLADGVLRVEIDGMERF
jgi:hypothetical protein